MDFIKRSPFRKIIAGTGLVVVIASGCSPQVGSSDNVQPSAVPECEPGSLNLVDGTYTGDKAEYDFGDLAVTVTIDGGCITTLETEYNTDNGLSKQIQAKADPLLVDEVMAAQSAEINTIAGATYTTNAYKTSLQAALDQAQ